MKFRIVLLIVLSLMLICSCKEATSRYKIPLVNKELVIGIPECGDYANVYIGTYKSHATINSFDLRIRRGETTDVAFVFSKLGTDTVYYSDRWDDVVVMAQKQRKYKRIRWNDSRFYTRKGNKHYVKENYIEVAIRDDATFVVCRTDSACRILEPVFQRSAIAK